MTTIALDPPEAGDLRQGQAAWLGRTVRSIRAFPPGSGDTRAPDARVVRVIALLAAMAAVVIAAIVPLSWFLAAQSRLRGEVEIHAKNFAVRAAEESRENPVLWNALAGSPGDAGLDGLAIARPPDADDPHAPAERRRVLSGSGTTLIDTATATPPAWPVLIARMPVTDGTTHLGDVEIARSLRPAVVVTALVACASTGLGLLVFVLLRVVPLRALSTAIDHAAILREREREAAAESRAKSAFLAMMSHEIRTPMNGVLGLAGALLDMGLTEGQRDTVLSIRQSGDSLMRILNDVLDYSKLGAGQMRFESAAFSPGALTENVLSLMRPRAIEKNLAIDIVASDDLPPGCLGDAGRLRQVLLNFVSNGIKFTERGSVRITVDCPERDTGYATIVWSVSDTGIGIPPDRLDGLFAEFYQADLSITRRFGGTGLGLAISKRLIEGMGGTITVNSRKDVGSTFTASIRLPAAEAPVETASPKGEVIASFEARLRHLGRPPRILFAEDNATNRMVAIRLLRGFDLRIDMVCDGLEAVRAAREVAYDMICMDMSMPDMDGLTATREIRAMGGRLARIPIVALTANAFPEDVAACFEAGMTGFAAKPLLRETLVAALLDALSGYDPDDADLVPEPRPMAGALPA